MIHNTEERGMMSAMKLRALVPLVLGALVGLGSFAAPASAHAEYERSGPGDGATVSSPPSEVWAEFSEPPAGGSYLQVFDPCGARVDGGDYSYLAKRMTVSVSADKAGTYVARWRVVSDLDSHPTAGEFSFDVTDGAACQATGSETTTSKRKDRAGTSDDSDADGSAAAGAGEKSGSDAEPSAAAGGAGDKAKPKSKRNKHSKHGKDRPDGNDGDPRGIDLVSENPADPVPGGDLPMDWLLISLFLAGSIGAAGGQIYLYLVDGPHH